SPHQEQPPQTQDEVSDHGREIEAQRRTDDPLPCLAAAHGRLEFEADEPACGQCDQRTEHPRQRRMHENEERRRGDADDKTLDRKPGRGAPRPAASAAAVRTVAHPLRRDASASAAAGGSFHPPPNALMSATLALSRWPRMLTACRSFASA